ncbi:hypothetical protein JW960_00020 [candidate division KSB1 bacterium]|nr:hypothetical protein [candidate division KSB1 bacterium]
MKNILINSGILLYAYPLGFIIGSVIIRRILIFIDPANQQLMGGRGIKIRNEGFWIGMCEHFLVVTFIFANQFTALGIVFAARGIVRSDQIKQNASYFLLGMLLSLCFATFVALTAKGLFYLINPSLLSLFSPASN